MNRTKTILACAIACALAQHGAALAQDKPANYPTRPIRLIVSVSAGAGADAIARAAAQMLVDAWGQNAVVDNRPGASGIIATELVAKSAPDGYTLLSLGDTLMLLAAEKRVAFDVLKAFDPVVPTSTQPYVLLGNLNVPFKTIKELVAYSATKPITYSGGTGLGNSVHLGMEHFAKLSGAKLLFVPYKGSAPGIIAATGGEIQTVAASAIAALGLTRIPAMPDLPTVAEQGYPGFKITNRYGLYAPAGTPRPILMALNRVVSDGMHSPQMTKRLEADGSQPAERMTPEQLKAAIAREYVEIEQQVKQLNLKIH